MFKRGFKTACERMAIEKRAQLKLGPTEPLDAWALAASLRMRVITPHEVPGLTEACLRTLLRDDPDSWSAVTLHLDRSGDLIILNSAHSHARQASDLAHELAHVILGHRPTRVDVTGDQHLLLRTHDPDQEVEAGWLAGCLLLPRPALLAIVRDGGPTIETARRYGVSMDMLAYRLRVSGVDLQRRRAGRRWATAP